MCQPEKNSRSPNLLWRSDGNCGARAQFLWLNGPVDIHGKAAGTVAAGTVEEMEATFAVVLCLLAVVAAQDQNASSLITPLNCTYAGAPGGCTSYLYHTQNATAADVASLYGVAAADVTAIPGATAFAIGMQCTCSDLPSGYSQWQTKVYSAVMTYTVSSQDANYSSIVAKFDNAVLVPDKPVIKAGTQQLLYLGCGCLPPQYTPYYTAVVTYKIQAGDILYTLSSTFGSNVSAIQSFNQLPNADLIKLDNILFIPVKSIDSINRKSSAPPLQQTGQTKKKGHSVTGIALGVAAAIIGVSLLLLCAALCARSKKSCCYEHRHLSEATGNSTVSATPELERGSIFSGFASLLGCAPLKRGGTAKNNNVKRNITLPKEANIVFDSEKPVVFTHEEIVASTDNFDERKKLGQGAFGLVYYGSLRNQEVAIKQMKATKSREFYAELKVLCKVHHTNLVELIGYAAGQENLYLVYEFAENGALSDRLHDPARRGLTPLSWNQRVQIAVDSARGLEYIHEHTKAHYVHRDVKTSNILLDGYFRAKVADFGLAKLVERTGDGGEGLTTRVVGTFGYLAPEYVRDGHATSKSDAYAFGVVLMELLTGCEAISKSKEAANESSYERRSLISLMLSVLLEIDAYSIFPDIVDPLLGDSYPRDGAYRMAMLAKACVEEDPSMRPDMRQVVLTLSQIMLASIEWEASLAGNSQVFSGLVQGR